MLKKTFDFRLAVICLAAASVGLSMVIVSLAKFLLILVALGTLLVAAFRHRPAGPALVPAASRMVLLVLAAFAVSLAWTTAPAADAFGSLAKYGKLLTLVVLVALIRNRREAGLAFACFLATQVALVAGSWLLFLGVPVPWATSNMASYEFSVFSSYLDQGIMGAALAGVCWHLRRRVPAQWGGQWLAIGVAVFALSNVLFVLGGRSGHVVSITLLSLAIMWELPRRFRLLVVVLPFLIAALLFASSARVRDKATDMRQQIQSYEDKSLTYTSSGIRLGFWVSALNIIRAHPVAGTGVGSWSTEYNRYQHTKNPAHKDIEGNSNPHQEYLLWGVQLGVPGVLLFAALLLSVLRDSLRMPAPEMQATQSALAAMAVACLFNASLYDALIGDFFCVALGLLLALGLHRREAVPTGLPAERADHGATLAGATA